MMISKAIVEAIYSMDSPGRFLKKCADSRQWRELSKREAAYKAAQSVAYLAIVNVKCKTKKNSHSLPSSSNDMCAVPVTANEEDKKQSRATSSDKMGDIFVA
eukprot:scaffold9736_cov94-Skeletonema_dohrnii-CCMP3373.AAC.1